MGDHNRESALREGAEFAELLTAAARLKTGLEGLPLPESAAYHPALIKVVTEAVPAIHRAYDAVVQAILITEGRKVTCSKACSACCRHYVSSVEPFELIALDHSIKTRSDYPEIIVSSHNKSMVYDRLVREEGADAEAEDRALYRYFLKGHSCSFLMKDGSCGVYESRPMSCRMFFAESSPRFCEGKAIASPWNKNFQVELPLEAEEALARCSRLLEGLDLSENLFPGLVEVNALFGRFDAPPPKGQPENPEVPPSPPRSSASGPIPPTSSP